MRRLLLVMSAALLLVALLPAASPVGTVSSPSSFSLRGARVPVEGIPSWPLLIGDEIVTGASAAVLKFSDGASAIVSENSRARVEEVDGKTTLRLVTGTMQVEAGAKLRSDATQFYVNNQPVSTSARQLATVSAAGPSRRPPGVPPGPPAGKPPPPKYVSTR